MISLRSIKLVPLISYSFVAAFAPDRLSLALATLMNHKSQFGFAIQGCCNFNLAYLRTCIQRNLLFGMWVKNVL